MSRDESIGLYTSHTVKNIIRFLTLHLKDFDVTPEQWTVLKRLAEQDGISQKQLAIRSEKDQPTVTRILDILERKELIYKQKNAEDRRSFLIFITEKGMKAKEELSPFIENLYEDTILKGISEEELEVYKSVLSQINANMTKG
ncbi:MULTISPECIES: MarR family transcriptional regulator [unclassified Rossellomorea]|uniref:MarR family winged helix-turn-helix transcriptional regulator n=1 Tax=unclassified Rossellomorea TaxID=2837526 RepID=UPI0020C5DAAC|nr:MULTISPECIES: MarR family transcriptional regulator [unclassified Rossellomorea]UTE77169.1 MarR family transcriptional regulator [Rossellomorea sp. KS-H15a]WGG48085.1 MarR family transcriptional regulator [Rossellomorea sp. DA94]